MRTNLRVMAAAVIFVGLASGCERTTAGNVAMTTQPGTSTSTRPSTTILRPTPSAPSRTSSIPEVPAPPNATTMTCHEYNGLDDATRLAVLRAILTDKNSMFPKGQEDMVKTIADAMCQFLPDSTVSELLAGSPP